MPLRILKVFAVCFAIILLAGCAPTPTPVPPTKPPPTAAPPSVQPQLPTATPKRDTWKLTPISLNAEAPSEGWISYHLGFFLENQSTEPALANINTGKGTVETQEGFTYEVDPIVHRSIIPIPPGFLYRDTNSTFNNALEMWFRAGDKLHPTRMKFPQYDPFDFNSIPKTNLDYSGTTSKVWARIPIEFPLFRNQGFPTLRPATDFRNLPATIEIPNKAKITFKQPVVVQQIALEIPVEYQNINLGTNTSVTIRCYLFDGIGLIRQDAGRLYGYGVGAGPGQTSQDKIQFSFQDAQDLYYNPLPGAMKPILTNGKLDCTGDVQAIFNINVNVQ